jgi:hypothetical protein
MWPDAIGPRLSKEVPMDTLFGSLLTLQLVAVAGHDLVDIPGWTHGAQVRAMIGGHKLRLVTLANAAFPGLAVALAIGYWNRPAPRLVADYWVIYCAVTLISAIAMWNVPYLFGATEEKKRLYAQMYAGTRQVLPARGENPRPNLLHVLFHALFVVNFVLVLALSFRAS